MRTSVLPPKSQSRAASKARSMRLGPAGSAGGASIVSTDSLVRAASRDTGFAPAAYGRASASDTGNASSSRASALAGCAAALGSGGAAVIVAGDGGRSSLSSGSSAGARSAAAGATGLASGTTTSRVAVLAASVVSAPDSSATKRWWIDSVTRSKCSRSAASALSLASSRAVTASYCCVSQSTRPASKPNSAPSAAPSQPLRSLARAAVRPKTKPTSINRKLTACTPIPGDAANTPHGGQSPTARCGPA